MNKKQMVFGLYLTALALSLSGAAMASEYEPNNLTIQMGANESELNFCWLTSDPNAPQLVVCKETDLVDGEFPEWASCFDVTIEQVIEEEASSGGPGGGTPPSGGPSSMAVADANEEEVEDAPLYSCKVTIMDVNVMDMNEVVDVNYVYAVGYGETFSVIDTFRPQDSNNYNFIFVGDPQIGASGDTDSDANGWAATVTEALTEFASTSFILSAGDQVESSTSDTQYQGFFTASELTSVPLAPASGNHDKSVLYSYQFNVPNESEYGKLESTSEDGDTLTYAGDYWFTYGKALFMVINSNNSSATSHSAFMDEAIAAEPNALWRVVTFHHSLYSSARHVDDVDDLRETLVPVMDEHDIDVVLAGHDHFYARTYPLTNFEVADDNSNVDESGRVIDPNGTVYFTANSASGSKYYDFSEIEGYTNYYLDEYSQPKEPSYLNVEVAEVEDGDTFTVSAYLTGDPNDPNDPTMLDTYTIIKMSE